PPASYDAESGPILNLVTSRNIVPGYKGSVNASLAQAIYPKFSAGTGHYFKTDKLHLFANYSINPKKELGKTVKGIEFMDPGNVVFSQWDTYYEQLGRSRSQSANLILDYDIDSNNSLNLTSTLLVNPNQRQQIQWTNDMRNGMGILDSTGSSLNETRMDHTKIGRASCRESVKTS